jgi:hypothetical protein
VRRWSIEIATVLFSTAIESSIWSWWTASATIFAVSTVQIAVAFVTRLFARQVDPFKRTAPRERVPIFLPPG